MPVIALAVLVIVTYHPSPRVAVEKEYFNRWALPGTGSGTSQIISTMAPSSG